MVLVGVVDGVGRESSGNVLLFILDVNRFKTSSILELAALFKLLLLLLLLILLLLKSSALGELRSDALRF